MIPTIYHNFLILKNPQKLVSLNTVLVFQKSKEEVDYAKIKEFTGVEDITIIRNAICMCKNKEGTYELTDVVNCLISDPTVKTASLPSTTRTVSSSFLTYSLWALNSVVT